jgi:hypothetical protein
MEKKNIAKVGAVAAAALVIGSLGTAVLHQGDVSQDQVDALVLEAQAKAFADGKASVVMPAPEVVTVEKIVIVEKIVEKEVVVEVDNEKLADVLQHIYDNEGNVEYLTDDLKDSEVEQIADRVIIVNDFKTMAVDAAKSEIADLVDKEVVGLETLDEDDVEKVRIDDEADEIAVDDIDFEDKDAVLVVTGEFEHDDIDYDFKVEVEFKDGEVEEVSLVSVSEQ